MFAICRLLIIAGLALVPSASWACRLALMLAVDVSASIDAAEYRLQRDGLAAALVSPQVRDALLSTPGNPVALSVFEFSGSRQQTTILSWTLIRSATDIAQAAARIRATARSNTEYPTAIGYALGHAAIAFRRSPACLQRKLDISGDGENNFGFAPALAFKHFPLDGITVNALAIGGDAELQTLIDYFAAEVVRGPGAFVEAALDHTDFAAAMRRKLLREIATLVIGEVSGEM